MITRKVSTMDFELDILVPGSIEEYNSLAPKRDNPVLEDAILNIVYRGILNKFRDEFLDRLEKVTGVARGNSGTEDEPVWEKPAPYYARVKATVAQQRGLDPAAKATNDALIAEWTPLAQEVISTFKFNPAEREATGGTPSLSKKYRKWAEEAFERGVAQKVAAALTAKGYPVEFSGDKEKDIVALARAITANEKAKAEAAKAEYVA